MEEVEHGTQAGSAPEHGRRVGGDESSASNDGAPGAEAQEEENQRPEEDGPPFTGCETHKISYPTKEGCKICEGERRSEAAHGETPQNAA